jgi:DNA-binding MarR family transcriptional regulator
VPAVEPKKSSNARAIRKTPVQLRAGKQQPPKAQRDPVGVIVAQWQRERPDLDPAPMRLFGALARAHLLTTPYLNRVVAAHGLARGTFDVLSALRRAGPPFSLTPKQLSDSLMLSGAGMTSRLDRLETLQLIVRLPEPADRRSLKIQLTPRGIHLIDDIIPRIIKEQWRVIGQLGAKNTATLIGLLGTLTEVLSAAAEGAMDERTVRRVPRGAGT